MHDAANQFRLAHPNEGSDVTTPAAAPSNCDVLYESYLDAFNQAKAAWRGLLFFTYATAVLLIVAVLLVYAGHNAADIAAAVALLSGAGAGGVATMAYRAQRRADTRLKAFLSTCPTDIAKVDALSI